MPEESKPTTATTRLSTTDGAALAAARTAVQEGGKPAEQKAKQVLADLGYELNASHPRYPGKVCLCRKPDEHVFYKADQLTEIRAAEILLDHALNRLRLKKPLPQPQA